jgi:hypothetical protein
MDRYCEHGACGKPLQQFEQWFTFFEISRASSLSTALGALELAQIACDSYP